MKIHNVFHVFLLEQNITKKGEVNDMQLDFKFKVGNNEEYEIDGIRNSAVYAKESTISQLLELYYLVLWKNYLEEENTWEPVLAIPHFQRLTNTYHKNYPKKLTATFLLVNMAPPIVRPMAALIKKRGRLAKFTTTITK